MFQEEMPLLHLFRCLERKGEDDYAPTTYRLSGAALPRLVVHDARQAVFMFHYRHSVAKNWGGPQVIACLRDFQWAEEDY
jgi:hypothetical protein